MKSVKIIKQYKTCTGPKPNPAFLLSDEALTRIANENQAGTVTHVIGKYPDGTLVTVSMTVGH